MVADTFRRDVRIGARVLIKEKAFCALAVVVLALGICGVTTMFSVVNGVMLRAFSFPNAARLASFLFIDPTTQTANGVNGFVSSMDFEEFRKGQQSFERIASYLNGSTVNMTVNASPQRYTGVYATEDFFKILGVTPFKGRDFEPADNRQGAEKVALISYGVWQRDFAGASNVVGTSVRINGKPATIIGVMPKGFAFPQNEDMWLPLYAEFPPKPREDPSALSPSVIGLLKPGVSVDQATAEATGVARRFAAAYPVTNKNFNAGQVQPLRETFTPQQLKGTLYVMLGFCVGVLLIACVNVMNMQFARATLRAKELAVRSSLGASRGRLIRQMLTESLLLATIGTVVGIFLASGAIEWLSATVRNLTNPPPAWVTFDMDITVLIATVAATVVAAVASGLLPAWMSSRANAIDVMRDGGRGNTSRGVMLVSRSLVVFQIVVTCILLVGSLLQVRSIVNQQSLDYGYDTNGLMSARVGLMAGDYPTSEDRKQFYDRFLQNLSSVPEFESGAFTSRRQMVFAGNSPIEIEGQTYGGPGTRPQANNEQVTSSYFNVLGQKVLEGRLFADTDFDSRLPVAVVNAEFAKKYLGGGSAVGRRFRTTNGDGSQPGTWRTVVGVVSTVRMRGPFQNGNADDSGFYVPYYATPFGPAAPAPVVPQFGTVVVKPRPGLKAEDMPNVLRREVRRVDPNLPIYFVGTPQSQVDGFSGQNRIIATMFSIFGVVAVVLAAVGIYGVMSFAVNRRTQEFGLRMALGANTLKILGMVLKQGGWQIAIGLTVGMALTVALAKVGGSLIQNTLIGVTATDPLTYTLVSMLVVVVSLFATLIPARRATKVDPMTAFRAD